MAQDMGMDYIGPWTFSAASLILGFLALLPFFFIFEYKKIKETKLNYKFVVGYIFFLGFLLAGGNILQQISLIYTDVANSAVFTVLYVVIVPIIGSSITPTPTTTTITSSGTIRYSQYQIRSLVCT